MADPLSSLPKPTWQKPQGMKGNALKNPVVKKPGRWRKIVLPIIFVWSLAVIIFLAILYLQGPRPAGEASSQPEVDSRPLLVQVVRPVREIINPYTEVTVIANKEITLQPSSRASLAYLGELGGEQYYAAHIDKLGIETTEVTLKFNDSAGNEDSQKLEITRKSFAFPVGYTEINSWPEANYVLDGNDLSATVNKQSRLLEDYQPDDLVDLNKDLGLYTLNDAQLRVEAGKALKIMLDDLAEATGKYVTVASGYRSYETQVQTYAAWVKELGTDGADAVSARPGHSEHQLGTTIDFVSDETGWQINNSFGDTVAGKWIIENCQKYGFILPYKTDQSQDGGYKEESWHFRYIGLKN